MGFGIPDAIRNDPGAEVNVAAFDRDSQTLATTSEAMRAAMTTHFKGAGPVDPSPRLRSGYRATSSVHQEREDSNSGPYRRVYTIPARFVGVTQTGEIATARLYCSNGNVPVISSTAGPKVNEPKSFNSGHTYLGGWSGQDDAADAGLQYNRNLAYNLSSDDYTPFVRDAPFKQASPNGNGSGDYMFAYYDETYPNAYHAVGFTDGQAWHIPCGTDVSMSFSIQSFNYDQNGNLVDGVAMVGSWKYCCASPGHNKYITIALYKMTGYDGYVLNYYGWNQYCDGCVFKRMTSVAQADPNNYNYNNNTRPQRDYFVDNNTYYESWTNHTVSCNISINWQADCNNSPDTFIPLNNSNLAGCTEHPTWTQPYSPGFRDCTLVPAGPFKVVKVLNFTPNTETDYLTNMQPVISPRGPYYRASSCPPGQRCLEGDAGAEQDVCDPNDGNSQCYSYPAGQCIECNPFFDENDPGPAPPPTPRPTLPPKCDPCLGCPGASSTQRSVRVIGPGPCTMDKRRKT